MFDFDYLQRCLSHVGTALKALTMSLQILEEGLNEENEVIASGVWSGLNRTLYIKSEALQRIQSQLDSLLEFSKREKGMIHFFSGQEIVIKDLETIEDLILWLRQQFMEDTINSSWSVKLRVSERERIEHDVDSVRKEFVSFIEKSGSCKEVVKKNQALLSCYLDHFKASQFFWNSIDRECSAGYGPDGQRSLLSSQVSVRVSA